MDFEISIRNALYLSDVFMEYFTQIKWFDRANCIGYWYVA